MQIEERLARSRGDMMIGLAALPVAIATRGRGPHAKQLVPIGNSLGLLALLAAVVLGRHLRPRLADTHLFLELVSRIMGGPVWLLIPELLAPNLILTHLATF